MAYAIIGTAGRDPSSNMDAALWGLMVSDAIYRIPKGASVVSGGAAWADHLAVHLYLCGHAGDLKLHLASPRPIKSAFPGARGTAAQAANYYHQAFSEVIGRSSIGEIAEAIERGAQYTTQPLHSGLYAFKLRNLSVAEDATKGALAYTWGNGSVPKDGGTAHTWRLMKCPKQHIPLSKLVANSTHPKD